MSKRANPAVIGFFVLSALALAIAGVIVYGSGRLFKETQTYVLFFDGSVKGLQVGAPVSFRGVRIGSVTEIRLMVDPETLNLRIPVLVEVDPRHIEIPQGAIPDRDRALDELVQRGLRGQIQMQSLVTGQLLIDLDFHPESPLRLVGADPAYRELPTVPSGMEEFYRVLGKLPLDKLVDQGVRTMEGIERLVNSPELAGSIRSLEQTLNDVRKAANNIDMQMSTLAADAGKTLADARKLFGNLDSQVAPSAQSLRRTANAATDALTRAEEVLTSLQDVAEEGSPLRYQILKTLQEMSAAARSIRVLTDSLQTHPEALLRGKAATGGER